MASQAVPTIPSSPPTPRRYKLPDITLAQACSALTWIAGQAVIMGLADQERTKIVLASALTVFASAWTIADAVIRSGRSRALLGSVTTPGQTEDTKL